MIFKKADVVVGRSGAGVVHECIHLGKKAIFIPLAIAQKNEQYHNALRASQLIDVTIIDEKAFTTFNLMPLLETVCKRKSKPISKPSLQSEEKPVQKIANIILGSIR